MIVFVVRRLIGMVLTLWVVFTVTFFLIRAVPGGPYSSERQLDPEIEANMRRSVNLDLPLYQQYFIQLGRTLRGDLLPSQRMKDFPVTEVIAQGLPVSAALGVLALAGCLARGRRGV